MNTQLSALKISAKTLLVIASLTLPLAASNAHAAVATLIHDYALNGTLADSIGSASLTSNGGTVGIDGYAFGPDQGPSLANAIDPFTYSIAMQFSLDATDGWRRLIDFKNRTSDNGLYNFGNKLQFVVVSGAEFVTGSTDVFAAGKTIDLVITRDGASKQFIGYIDGIPQITFTDTADGAVFDATPDHLIQFLRDDLVFSGESAGGLLNRIRIYDGVLTPEQAVAPPGPPVPIPAAVWLFASALAGFGWFGKRRKPA